MALLSIGPHSEVVEPTRPKLKFETDCLDLTVGINALSTITMRARRDNMTSVALLTRAITAYSIIFPAHHLTNDGFGIELQVYALRISAETRAAIVRLVDRDGVVLPTLLAWALEADALMYPGPDYRPAA